jgi:glyoxylase-like metal-dependent hydrolase (beta-lactamase superfamily II)
MALMMRNHPPSPIPHSLRPGIYRIPSVLGPRPFSQYVLKGERMMLVDTGINTTPADVILPWFEANELDIAALDLVLNSHADVDHCGGNHAIRQAAPNAVFMAGDFDTRWIENRELMLAERYGWYEKHGPEVDYDAETKAFLKSALGLDMPIDQHLFGGESLDLGDGLVVEVLALPGHSEGHLGLWEPQSRTAIVIDAVLGAGLLNMDGQVIHPPPYQAANKYEATIAKVRNLNPQRLLTAHYEPMEGAEVHEFLDKSQDFVDRARFAVARELESRGEATLAEMLDALNPALGPFTSFANELAGPILDHLVELVGAGKAFEVADAVPLRWQWNKKLAP